MCGRFTLRASANVLGEQFLLFDVPPFATRFNIAPSQPVPVVRLVPDRAAPRRELAWLRWGLIPSWAKDPAIGYRTINARAETAAERPAFRTAIRRRRCLVVADGFYEWQGSGKQKQPFFIRMRDDRPFAFAGLWETWQSPDRSPIESCTILTTEPNELVAGIHDRMPVILPPDAYAGWLDPTVDRPEKLAEFWRPYPAEAMVADPVGTFVNSPSHEGPECIELAPGLFS